MNAYNSKPNTEKYNRSNTNNCFVGLFLQVVRPTPRIKWYVQNFQKFNQSYDGEKGNVLFFKKAVGFGKINRIVCAGVNK